MAGLFEAMRPRHWIKNAIVFAPVLFAQRADEPALLLRVAVAFVAFAAVSAAVYLINDVVDREADRLHPVKRRRAIASGRLSIGTALVAASLVAAGGLAAGRALGWMPLGITALYLASQLAYSLLLKRVAIVDVMTIAAGFLLRAWVGSAAIGVTMSRWLVLCTALLALMLGFIKRRQELVSWRRATEQRPSLADYAPAFLDQAIGICAACTVLAYTLYVFSPETAARFGTPYMGLTLPFVLYGIFRYLQLVHRDGAGESPTTLVLRDAPLAASVVLWALAAAAVIYLD